MYLDNPNLCMTVNLFENDFFFGIISLFHKVTSIEAYRSVLFENFLNIFSFFRYSVSAQRQLSLLTMPLEEVNVNSNDLLSVKENLTSQKV